MSWSLPRDHEDGGRAGDGGEDAIVKQKWDTNCHRRRNGPPLSGEEVVVAVAVADDDGGGGGDDDDEAMLLLYSSSSFEGEKGSICEEISWGKDARGVFSLSTIQS